MNKLKDLVPPWELCKLIPEGEFADSALIHIVDKSSIWGWVSIVRERTEYKPKFFHYPAPTLREIMKNIRSDEQFFCSFYDGEGDEDKQSWSIGEGELDFFVRNGFEGKNPEELALKWWLKSKGIAYE